MQGWESLWIHLWGWFSSKPGSAFVKSPHFQSCCVGRRNTQLPAPIVNLALKIRIAEKQQIEVFPELPQHAEHQGWCWEAVPGFLQLWDWQAEVKLSPSESSPVKQVWDEGSPFTMKDAGSKGGADKSRFYWAVQAAVEHSHF